MCDYTGESRMFSVLYPFWWCAEYKAIHTFTYQHNGLSETINFATEKSICITTISPPKSYKQINMWHILFVCIFIRLHEIDFVASFFCFVLYWIATIARRNNHVKCTRSFQISCLFGICLYDMTFNFRYTVSQVTLFRSTP